MSELDEIAGRIRGIGFRCHRCGACCQGEGMRVLVYPAEVRAISWFSGLYWDEVAEPYPEEINLSPGIRCTFEWALRIIEGRCIFLEGNRCRVYPFRPWICRTYPFVLDGSVLQRCTCPGLAEKIAEDEARTLAHDLMCRRETEREEEDRVQALIRHLDGVRGRRILIDGEGVNVLEP
jgi:Fe-S-cluster containining protein